MSSDSRHLWADTLTRRSHQRPAQTRTDIVRVTKVMPRPPHAEPRSGAEPKTRWETNEEEMRMVDKKGERSGRKQKRKEIREQIQEHAGMNRFPEQIRGRTDSGINRFGKRTKAILLKDHIHYFKRHFLISNGLFQVSA